METRQKIREMASQGTPVWEISEILEVCKSSVRAYANKPNAGRVSNTADPKMTLMS